MTDGNEKTKGSPKTVWASVGAPKHLQRRDNVRSVGTHEGLRSEGVDTQIQGQSEDDWLQRSVDLVARKCNGIAKNQRRVRYFGFEKAHD